MEELLKKIFFAGVGTLALTYDKSKELVDDLIKKGKITVEQGKEINEELKRTVRKEGEVEKDKILDELNLATKDDIKEILARLDKIEDKNEQ